jgi:hypothetical protein
VSRRKEDAPFSYFVPMFALTMLASSTIITVVTGGLWPWPLAAGTIWLVAQAVAAIEDHMR